MVQVPVVWTGLPSARVIILLLVGVEVSGWSVKETGLLFRVLGVMMSERIVEISAPRSTSAVVGRVRLLVMLTVFP